MRELFIGSIASRANKLYIFNDEQFLLPNLLEHSHDLKIITQPIKYTVKDINSQTHEYSILHPLAQLCLFHFFTSNSFKFYNFFNLNKIYSTDVFNTITDKNLRDSWNQLCNAYNISLTYGHKLVSYKYTEYNNASLEMNLNRLERKYNHYQKMEYFAYKEHLYTHSLDWAYLGEREIAKKYLHLKKRFSSLLDTLMQKSNYNETNGIFDGNPISDIVGEFVLTRLDRLVYDELKNKNMSFKKDYEIVRDGKFIYIYAVLPEYIDVIKDSFINQSRIYRLNISANKPISSTKPFNTDYIWKTSVNNITEDIYKKLWTDISLLSEQNNSLLLSNMLNELRSIILLHDYDYKVVSYFLHLLAFKLKERFISQPNTIHIYINPFEQSTNSDIAPINICTEQITRYFNFILDVCSININELNVDLLICNIEYAISNMLSTVDNQNQDLCNCIFDIAFNTYFQILRFNTKSNISDINNIILICSFYEKNIPQELLLAILENSPNNIAYIYISFYIHKKELKYKYTKVCTLIKTYCTTLLDALDKKCDFDSKAGILPSSTSKKETFGDLIGKYELLLLFSFRKTNILTQDIVQRICFYKNLSLLLKNTNSSFDKEFITYICSDTFSWLNWDLSKNELICLLSQSLI